MRLVDTGTGGMGIVLTTDKGTDRGQSVGHLCIGMARYGALWSER